MKWSIPAKTFLIGEYLALAGGPAIVLTTEPCFSATLVGGESDVTGGNLLSMVSPESPAGKFWQSKNISGWHLKWDDPYLGTGGFGASTAQFLAAFNAYNYLLGDAEKRLLINRNKSQVDWPVELLNAYYNIAWNGVGLCPSGYDLLAQTYSPSCVYIHKQTQQIKSYSWPFQDIEFKLIKTNYKLPTHKHLEQQLVLPDLCLFEETVLSAQQAFERVDSRQLIHAINLYHKLLMQHNWVTQETQELLIKYLKNPNVLAAKGCGALGADVILLIIKLD